MIDLPDEDLSSEGLAKYLETKVFPKMNTECERLDDFEAWTKNGQEVPDLATRHKNKEREVLQQLSRKPWMGLMVNSFAQQLIVDGYRKTGTNENAKGWDTWRLNQMDKQQFWLNRAVLTFGYAFIKVTSGISPLDGTTVARIKCIDPRDAFAIWEDPYWDEWPKYLLERQPNGQYWWWTEEDYSIFEFKQGKFIYRETVSHDYGHIPFVRYVNVMDLRGVCYGDVEPLVTVAKAIDKTGLDILLVQHHQSFQIRWATGLMLPEGANADQEKMRFAQESMLISQNEKASFGAIPAAPLDGLLNAYKESLLEFLALAQLPPHIAGQIVNVAADALAAGTRQTMQKLFEKQATWKASHNQTMRLVNKIEGRTEEATDLDFTITWQDVTIQSLAQFADAWAKMVESLKIPAEGVWDMIPNLDQSTVNGWKEIYDREGDFGKYMRKLQNGPDPAEQRGGPNGATNMQQANNKTGEPASLNKSGA
ncbi:hypothetical protein Wildcat_27 [Mycobacterium phage Wildcat]|uniref:Portal protein n=2 Tax=Mycobacterium virus Wildcat TaxID=1993859 RepID=Q19Y33_9CAUD|nr:hypothetical protein Wildcat_27 [Mycobacterium phage Wildcat]ABE67632.1 hypothetical protein Wildcat_27 [Mycobacterium phage Wildcat]QGJ89917.1 portal protein [Mycobacterium phage MaryV]WKR36037.1 portal protein [Mycobacterium phage Azrael100]